MYRREREPQREKWTEYCSWTLFKLFAVVCVLLF